ncbi:signal peptidase II [Spiroplasma diminutum]|uniref:Lipoprotein signal peptidase n=1 Tax=Spiroplasma diminutum CUAS-1 TaxID=1276221 RepID=S5MK27_9MOLU|nr:signal peptidase II [Spiroplasma diminutum]AGR42320.1 lipoprotein signal peptidase [Spiroplasma diminutum CUAS-1]
MQDFIFNIKSNLKNYNFIFKYKLVWCLPLILFLVVLDWISKAIVVSNMKIEGTTAKFIPGFIEFEYKINPGAAYGMNAENKGLAISIAALVTVFLILIFVFMKNKYWLIPINLMVAGSFANLLGRAWAPSTLLNGKIVKGGVVDFIKFDFNFLGSNSYIFNLADAWVSIAVGFIIVIMFVYIYFEIKEAIMKSKHQEDFEVYAELRAKQILLFETYWSSSFKKNENSITYKQYLKTNKEIHNEWKKFKKGVNNGTSGN